MRGLGRRGRVSAGVLTVTLSWSQFIYALALTQLAETVPVAVLTQLVEGNVYH